MKSEDIILVLKDTAQSLNYKYSVSENTVDFLDDNDEIVTFAYVSELDGVIVLYDYICQIDGVNKKFFNILNSLNMNDELFRFVIQENEDEDGEKYIMLLIEYQIYPISKSHVSKKIKEEMPKFIERRDFYRQCIKDAMLKFNK